MSGKEYMQNMRACVALADLFDYLLEEKKISEKQYKECFCSLITFMYGISYKGIKSPDEKED